MIPLRKWTGESSQANYQGTVPPNFQFLFDEYCRNQRDIYYNSNIDFPLCGQLPRWTRGTVTEVLSQDRLRITVKPRNFKQPPQPKSPLPSPPGGAVAFHPSLFTRVISADGTRQRRLSEVGIKKEEKENEDPRASEESSAQGEQRARVVYPESEYQGTPLVDLTLT